MIQSAMPLIISSAKVSFMAALPCSVRCPAFRRSRPVGGEDGAGDGKSNRDRHGGDQAGDNAVEFGFHGDLLSFDVEKDNPSAFTRL
jgi:hypothetical protein